MVTSKKRLSLATELFNAKRGKRGVTKLSTRHEAILNAYRAWYAHTMICEICREEWGKVDPVAAKGCFEGVRLWTVWRELNKVAA